jgi:uncharacterized OB-fold protein
MTDEARVFIADYEVRAPYLHSTGPAVGRFLAALRDDCALWGRRCETCDRVVVPAQDHCDTCGAELAAWVRVGPEGTVTGLAVAASGTAFARIRLDDAGTDLVHVIADPRGVTRGARVRPIFAEHRVGSIRDIVTFALASGAAPAAALAPASPNAPAPPAAPVTSVATELRLPFRSSAGALQSRFQDAVRQGEIRSNRCPSCQRVYVPPRSFCARCACACEGWMLLPDTGALVTYVVVNVPFHGQEIEIPYVLGNILLDGASMDFLHLLGTTGADGKLVAPRQTPRIGARVRAVWRPAPSRRGFLNDDIDHFEISDEPTAEPEETA